MILIIHNCKTAHAVFIFFWHKLCIVTPKLIILHKTLYIILCNITNNLIRRNKLFINGAYNTRENR